MEKMQPLSNGLVMTMENKAISFKKKTKQNKTQAQNKTNKQTTNCNNQTNKQTHQKGWSVHVAKPISDQCIHSEKMSKNTSMCREYLNVQNGY